jgi:hypothetical protein
MRTKITWPWVARGFAIALLLWAGWFLIGKVVAWASPSTEVCGGLFVGAAFLALAVLWLGRRV